MIEFLINDQQIKTTEHPATVALDFIRNNLRLTGSKEGCKEGECGACTVLIGGLNDKGVLTYKACASCLLPLGELRNKHLVTIEGLNQENLNMVQQAIFDESASQCGFCTPGIVLSLTGFLLNSKDFSYEDAINALDGNICRCTGYASIKEAAKSLSKIFGKKKPTSKSRIEQLVEFSVLPEYFLTIQDKLKQLSKQNKKQKMVSSKNSVFVAGGTDLFVQKPDELLSSDIILISNGEDLKTIRSNKTHLIVGSGVTTEDFRTSSLVNKYFPSIKEDFLRISSTIMRNKATLVGNIVNASPIGDITIVMLALDAILCFKQGNKTRELALNKFFKGYKSYDLAKGELIEFIKIPLPKKGSKFNFEKVSNREYLDIAACNSAMYIETTKNKINKINISAGGVAPVPLYLKKTCNYLQGKEITNSNIQKAAKYLMEEIAPIDDIRGSAKYKKLLIKQLFLAHFVKLFNPPSRWSRFCATSKAEV